MNKKEYTGFRDWLVNFWYYNKVYVLIGAAVLALLVWDLRPSANRDEHYDFCVGIVTPKYYDDSQLDALAAALSVSHGKTDILCYHVALGAHDQDSVEISKLDIDLNFKTSNVFLVDDPETFLAVCNVPFSAPVPVSELGELKGLGFDDLSLVSRLDY